ncbi:uncharacterized protein LOC131221709 [Magnolia sinica]|uniref:uncharacterized protein LOC131221709 n=1 Tax=Magnolia sinica TaxID=86752 RepID=UPI0026584377|nr:uncharacterized protein LOC131221709 [Magnolia sinica]
MHHLSMKFLTELGVGVVKGDQQDARRYYVMAIKAPAEMKLNPSKCAFGVSSGKFLGFLVNQRGIEVNVEKIKALLDMESPKTIKDVERLIERVAALNRFLSRATDKCLSFFKQLKGRQTVDWTEECEAGFSS